VSALLLSLLLAAQAAAAPTDWPAYADAVVAADGSGQFRSVQDAILAAPTARAGQPWIIYVRAGTYRERLYVQREKRFVALVGENAETTVVSYDLHANIPGPDGRACPRSCSSTARRT
jgi:pectinesterase